MSEEDVDRLTDISLAHRKHIKHALRGSRPRKQQQAAAPAPARGARLPSIQEQRAEDAGGFSAPEDSGFTINPLMPNTRKERIRAQSVEQGFSDPEEAFAAARAEGSSSIPAASRQPKPIHTGHPSKPNSKWQSGSRGGSQGAHAGGDKDIEMQVLDDLGGDVGGDDYAVDLQQESHPRTKSVESFNKSVDLRSVLVKVILKYENPMVRTHCLDTLKVTSFCVIFSCSSSC
jgi:hypothetical protein